MKIYRLSGNTQPGNPSGTQIVFDSGHGLSTDIPKKMGGQDSAAQPVEHLLAAWVGCTQATALYVSRQMRIRLDRLDFVDICAYRDERGALELPIDEIPSVPSRLTKVTGTIHVLLKSGELSADKLHLLQSQTEARCPVANMILASGCDMNLKWVEMSYK